VGCEKKGNKGDKREKENNHPCHPHHTVLLHLNRHKNTTQQTIQTNTKQIQNKHKTQNTKQTQNTNTQINHTQPQTTQTHNHNHKPQNDVQMMSIGCRTTSVGQPIVSRLNDQLICPTLRTTREGHTRDLLITVPPGADKALLWSKKSLQEYHL